MDEKGSCHYKWIFFLVLVLTSSSGWNISNGHGLSSHWSSDIKGLKEEVNACLSVRGKIQIMKYSHKCLNGTDKEKT